MGYTFDMKTAVSIPDEIFADAERLAKALKKSRSQLYSHALREYIARHAPDEITEALDEVCADVEQPGDGFVPAASRHVLRRTQW